MKQCKTRKTTKERARKAYPEGEEEKGERRGKEEKGRKKLGKREGKEGGRRGGRWPKGRGGDKRREKSKATRAVINPTRRQRKGAQGSPLHPALGCTRATCEGAKASGGRPCA